MNQRNHTIPSESTAECGKNEIQNAVNAALAYVTVPEEWDGRSAADEEKILGAIATAVELGFKRSRSAQAVFASETDLLQAWQKGEQLAGLLGMKMDMLSEGTSNRDLGIVCRYIGAQSTNNYDHIVDVRVDAEESGREDFQEGLRQESLSVLLGAFPMLAESWTDGWIAAAAEKALTETDCCGF